MSEKDAKKVADWLDGNHQIPLDKETQEAIIAIRPDWAPEPNVSIEEILARVEVGPLGTSEEEDPSAEAFVTAVFQTRNAVPKTSIDDILNVVQDGPLGKLQTAEPNVVPLQAWWKRPSVGILTAAAVAFIILLPSRFMVPEYSEQPSEVKLLQETTTSSPKERAPQREDVAEEPSVFVENERLRLPQKAGSRESTVSKQSASFREVELSSSAESLKAPPSVSQRKVQETVQSTASPSETSDTSPLAFDESRLQIVEEKQTVTKRRRTPTLKKRGKSSIATEEMEEAPPPSALAKQSWFGTPASRISSADKLVLQQAEDISVVLDLCSSEDPTKSLDMLWYAAQFQNASNALKLLLSSEDYSDGDKRYLARNYHALGDLFAALGREDEARGYYTLASELR